MKGTTGKRRPMVIKLESDTTKVTHVVGQEKETSFLLYLFGLIRMLATSDLLTYLSADTGFGVSEVFDLAVHPAKNRHPYLCTYILPTYETGETRRYRGIGVDVASQ